MSGKRSTDLLSQIRNLLIVRRDEILQELDSQTRGVKKTVCRQWIDELCDLVICPVRHNRIISKAMYGPRIHLIRCTDTTPDPKTMPATTPVPKTVAATTPAPKTVAATTPVPKTIAATALPSIPKTSIITPEDYEELYGAEELDGSVPQEWLIPGTSSGDSETIDTALNSRVNNDLTVGNTSTNTITNGLNGDIGSGDNTSANTRSNMRSNATIRNGIIVRPSGATAKTAQMKGKSSAKPRVGNSSGGQTSRTKDEPRFKGVMRGMDSITANNDGDDDWQPTSGGTRASKRKTTAASTVSRNPDKRSKKETKESNASQRHAMTSNGENSGTTNGHVLGGETLVDVTSDMTPQQLREYRALKAEERKAEKEGRGAKGVVKLPRNRPDSDDDGSSSGSDQNVLRWQMS